MGYGWEEILPAVPEIATWTSGGLGAISIPLKAFALFCLK